MSVLFNNANDIVIRNILQSYIALSLPSEEVLAITPGIPASLTTMSVVFSHNFEYANGSIKYIGDRDIIVRVDGAISLKSSTNNTIVTISFSKNNVPSSVSEVERK